MKEIYKTDFDSIQRKIIEFEKGKEGGIFTREDPSSAATEEYFDVANKLRLTDAHDAYYEIGELLYRIILLSAAFGHDAEDCLHGVYRRAIEYGEKD